MYGTGKIGFWSLMEEGIGIIAGSLPALRPLLSLKVGFSSSMGTGNNTPAGYASGRSEPRSKPNRNILSRQDALALSTFQTLNGGEEYDHDDADSQKNIVKETKYTVTSSSVPVHECQRKQVLGWENGQRT
jgi:hypothetical protein